MLDPIETERLTLRPVLREEAETILRGEKPEGLLYGPGYPSEFSHEVMEIFAGSRQADAEGFVPWFVLRKTEGDLIGEIGYSTPEDPCRPSVGYAIVEPLWGKGYASEALGGLLARLFADPDIEAVQADTFIDHIASRRVMEKSGMTHFATRNQEVDGELRTLVFYEVKRR